MKGLAVSQIIMLVLGIIVLAVIGYLLYSNFLSSSGSVSFEQCRAQFVNACNSCKLIQGNNWPTGTETTCASGLNKNCIGSLIQNGVSAYSNFDGCTSTNCDKATGKFAPSACAGVGIN